MIVAGEVLSESAPELARLIAEVVMAPAFNTADLERRCYAGSAVPTTVAALAST